MLAVVRRAVLPDALRQRRTVGETLCKQGWIESPKPLDQHLD